MGILDPPAPETSKRSAARVRAPARFASAAPAQAYAHATVLEEARAAGLLEGGKSEHVSFRAPPGLIEAAKRETGITSTTELGLRALALLAQPDPVVSVMRRNRGSLGADHQLDH